MTAAIEPMRMSRFFDMREFMRDNPFQFISVQHLEKAGGHRHRRVFGIASGGKGIGVGLSTT
jgi:hypothetical protein